MWYRIVDWISIVWIISLDTRRPAPIHVLLRSIMLIRSTKFRIYLISEQTSIKSTLTLSCNSTPGIYYQATGPWHKDVHFHAHFSTVGWAVMLVLLKVDISSTFEQKRYIKSNRKKNFCLRRRSRWAPLTSRGGPASRAIASVCQFQVVHLFQPVHRSGLIEAR